MADHPLYGKRKKRLTKCPNPLFEKWLKEMKEDAASKGIKTQYVYAKALKSLQKYPLLLTSGKDCKMLEYFGDKLCKMLDDKLAKHIAEYGVPDTSDTSSYGPSDHNLTKPKTVPVKRSRANQNVKTQPQSVATDPDFYVDSENDNLDVVNLDSHKTKYMTSKNTKSFRTLHQMSESDSGEDDYACKPLSVPNQAGQPYNQIHELSDSDCEQMDYVRQPPKKRQKSGEKEYIPGYRSGPYALLLTLYRKFQSPDSRRFMTKNELLRAAQPLADKSFSIPDPGCRYTSWSSMGTLIKKGFVIKESSPAKYSLTDSGCELAHKLEFVQAGEKSSTCVQSASHDRMDPGDIPSVPVTNNMSGFVYTYITEDSREVHQKDAAAVMIDDNLGVGFLIKCNYQKLLGSGKRYKLDTTRPLGESVYVYLHNDDSEDRSPTAHPDEPVLNKPKPFVSQPLQKPVNGEPKARSSKKQTNSVFTSKKASQLLPLMEDLQSSDLLDGNIGSTYERSNSQESALSSRDSQNSIQSISSTSSIRSLPAPDFILSPGEYEIILCVDNAEFYGSRQGAGKSLLPELVKNGVKCDLRKLQVGDLLWIASKKQPSLPGQLQAPKSYELALDYVIERKRMDDLVHSCTDGRLQDQKFRLKHCGLRRPIFMIEDYGSMQHFSIPEDRIRQTITNLKVIDGFQVKRTKDMKESVAYLTVMTRYIQSYYQNKSLIACSPDELREFSNTYDINDTEQRLMTFEQFNKGSVKSKNLTVQEMFGKQLIQMHGMSAERAKVITDMFPTISHLVEAYDKCITTKEKEAMLSTVKCNKSMRNLGMNISKQIYQLYCTTGPLT